MTRRVRIGLIVLLLCAAAPITAFAQDSIDALIGHQVAAVRLEIEGRPIQSAQILALIDVHPGEALQIAAIRTSESRLLGAGGYEDVRVLATQLAGGVDVLFQLQPRHPITSVQYRGETGLTPRQLKNLVEKDYGGSITAAPQRAIVSLAQTALAGEGYRHATVTASVERQHRPERGILVLTVNAGPRSTVRNVSVRLSGSAAPSQRDVLSKTQVVPGLPYRADVIDAKLLRIRDNLRSKQHYEASASHTATPVSGSDAVDVVMSVAAGDRVVLASSGDTWPFGDWKSHVPIAVVGSADKDFLDDRQIEMASVLRRGGYANAQVTYSRVSQNGDTLITYHFALGPRFVIDRIEVVGDSPSPASMTLAQLGLEPEKIYDLGVIGGAVARIKSDLFAHGYYDARVELEPEVQTQDSTPATTRMLVRLRITAGLRVTIKEIVFPTPHTVPEAELRDLMQSKVGDPFVMATRTADVTALTTFYRNRGFLTAAPTIVPTRVDDGHGVILTVDPKEGPQVFLDDVRIIGNSRISEQAIKEEMTLEKGQPFGEAKALDSQRRLLETALFRRVTFTPEPIGDDGRRVRLLVAVEEAQAVTYSYGGGVEAPLRQRHTVGGGLEDRREFSPRGSFEITRHNLFGRNQSISFFSRISITPKTSDDPLIDGHGIGFSDYRVATLYKDDHAFRSTTSLAFGASSEQGIRPTYNYLRRGVTAEALRPLGRGLTLSGKYALDFTRKLDSRIPVGEEPAIDRLLPGVRLSILSTGFAWDRRKNGLASTSGTLVTLDGETALRPIGSQVGYVKAFVQGLWLKSSTTKHVVTLAVRGQFGAAHGFARDVPVVDEDGNPALGPDGEPLTERVEDLPASQRFYAGGSNSVRGFPQDRLGVPAIITATGLSKGGSGMVVFNTELRTAIGRVLGYRVGAAVFVDAGNVFQKAGDISLRELRAAAGFGLRFDSPLGALRTDFGFKFDRRTIGGKLERGWEFHLNFGEAF